MAVLVTTIWPLFALIVLGLAGAVFYSWWADLPFSAPLAYTVPTWSRVQFFERHALYAWLHLFAVLPVFALSFDKRVHFYTSWRHLFPAALIVGAFFILWDVIFTAKGVWGFNEAYFLGLRLLGLPMEEWLFFVTIPFASIFIYECLNYYVPKDWLAPADRFLSPILILGLLLVGLLNFSSIYTSSSCLLTGGFLLVHWLCFPNTYRTRFYFAYLIIWIPFLLVDGVLTGAATAAPIVLYNPEEFLGIRIVSVPIEDSVYGFLLLFGVVTIMEFWREKR